MELCSITTTKSYTWLGSVIWGKARHNHSLAVHMPYANKWITHGAGQHHKYKETICLLLSLVFCLTVGWNRVCPENVQAHGAVQYHKYKAASSTQRNYLLLILHFWLSVAFKRCLPWKCASVLCKPIKIRFFSTICVWKERNNHKNQYNEQALTYYVHIQHNSNIQQQQKPPLKI